MGGQHTKKGRKLCFVALIPDEPVYSEVQGFTEEAAELFGSRRALNSPPHITLFPPFFLDKNDIAGLGETLKEWGRGQSSFTVLLSGFSAFPPRVIFVDVVRGPELNAAQSALAEMLTARHGLKGDDRPYHPHMTLAFKDLRKKMFRPALDHFNRYDYHRSFRAERAHLLEHDGRKWRVTGHYPFLAQGR